MIQKLYSDFRVQEARGHLRGISPAKATIATILGASLVAFNRGYYGQGWTDALSEARQVNNAEQTAAHFQDAMLSELTRDVRPLCVSLSEASSTDFPILLDNVRNRVIRETYQAITDTPMIDAASKRTVSNFRQIKGVRYDTLDELRIRPEGADVTFAEIGYTEDGYSIASYELGWKCTWELIKNDDLSVAQNSLLALGKAARRTRAKTLLRALLALNRTTLSTVGGPTIDRLEALISTELGSEVNADGQRMGVTLTDIAFPTKWKTTAAAALTSATVVGPSSARNPSANPVFGAATPHEDTLMAEVLTDDWIGWDRNANWLEFATLDDFVAGPATYTQMPDVVENLDQGSFMNHSIAVKIGDAIGAKVTSNKGVRRIAGA